jgi:Na+:H+ antiporter, NhaA family
VRRALDFAFDHYLLAPLGGAIALIWANASSATYFEMTQPLTFAVNDVGMAIVLAYVAQGVFEAASVGGSLHSWRRAYVPIVGAVGATAGAVFVYVAFIGAGDQVALMQGWPVVCAVDLFLSLAVARVVFQRRPAIITFVLALAIASDVIGLVVISRPMVASSTHPTSTALLVPAIGASVALRRAHVRSAWPYVVVAGSMSWFACFFGGWHPALALLPIVPFLRHEPRNWIGFDDPADGAHATSRHFEYIFKYPIQAIVLLFGLVNAGVLIRGVDAGTWAVVVASLVGRPLGIVAALVICRWAGLPLPRGLGWRETSVIALAASPGAGFGLFFASAVFPIGPMLMQARIGALFTVAGVLLALGAARALRVGRFAAAAEQTE